MPGKTEFIYWDTCVFLSLLSRRQDRIQEIEAALDEAKSAGECRVATSMIAKVEVAYLECERDSGVMDPRLESQIDAVWSDYHTFEVVDLHEAIAIAARRLLRAAREERGPGDGAKPRKLTVPDAIHLATAKWLGASRICTYDPDLRRWAHLVGLPVDEPHPAQPRLPSPG